MEILESSVSILLKKSKIMFKTVFVDLTNSSVDVLGCAVSDCRPGFYVSSLTEGGRAELLGLEMGDKILAINGQSVDNLVTDEVGARLKQRSFFVTFARSSTDTIQMLVNFLTQAGLQNDA